MSRYPLDALPWYNMAGRSHNCSAFNKSPYLWRHLPHRAITLSCPCSKNLGSTPTLKVALYVKTYVSGSKWFQRSWFRGQNIWMRLHIYTYVCVCVCVCVCVYIYIYKHSYAYACWCVCLCPLNSSVCFTTGPQPPPKRVLHRMRSSVFFCQFTVSSLFL
jgi:hypothetical protein